MFNDFEENKQFHVKQNPLELRPVGPYCGTQLTVWTVEDIRASGGDVILLAKTLPTNLQGGFYTFQVTV